jgi:YidC/Oxa1 family membrane protein insertase
MFNAFGWVWNAYFYAPLFNALIWLYNGPAEQNLGVAIIYLTIGIRIIILPISILAERNKHIYATVEAQILEIEKQYKNDPEIQKDRIRELLRSHHVSPWSRVSSIVIQALVLVVLYQVIMSGIKMNRFDALYPSVVHPDIVFPDFLGINLGQRSWIGAAIVMAWLYLEISHEQKKHGESVTRADIFYRLAFPVFCFVALYILPSAKSLFILTSMSFSFIIGSFRRMFFGPDKTQ